MSEASKNLIDCRSSIDLALVRIWAAVVSIQLTCKYFNACSYKFKKINKYFKKPWWMLLKVYINAGIIDSDVKSLTN